MYLNLYLNRAQSIIPTVARDSEHCCLERLLDRERADVRLRRLDVTPLYTNKKSHHNEHRIADHNPIRSLYTAEERRITRHLHRREVALLQNAVERFLHGKWFDMTCMYLYLHATSQQATCVNNLHVCHTEDPDAVLAKLHSLVAPIARSGR
jgi:hypothetical protein